MYFSAFPEEISEMRCCLFKSKNVCHFSQRSVFHAMQGNVSNQSITSWSRRRSAMIRPPPPPVGQPGASLPHPEKAVR